MRMLISRIENEQTGEVLEDFQVPPDPVRYQELYDLDQRLGKVIIPDMFPVLEGVQRPAKNSF